MIAANKARGEMLDAMAKEMEQQQRFRNEALGVFQPHVQTLGVETARQQIGEGAQQRQQVFQDIGQTQLGIGQNQSKGGQAQYQMRGQARANLGGYSDWSLNQMIAKLRAQDELNRISNFSSGQARIFPYKMSDAQHSADDMAAIGGLIASIGGGAANIGGIYGQGASGGTPYQFQPPPFGAAGTGGTMGGWESGFGSNFEGQV